MKSVIAAIALFTASATFAQDVVATAPAPVPTKAEAMTIQADDHVMGSADAEHDLVTYVSVTCGHCRDWFNGEWPKVKSELVETGKLRVAVRELPTSPAQVSVAGFMLANCAGEEAWFDNIEMQFERQDATIKALSEGKGQDAFVQLANDSGLDGEDGLNACLADDAQFARIDKSIQRYEVTGAQGVPAFFLDGKPFTGAHKASDIAAALD